MIPSRRPVLARRLPALGGIVLLAALIAPSAGMAAQVRRTPVSGTTSAAATETSWGGRLDLYRTGVFSSQKTFTWCVAASVQMMLNIIDGTHDHSRTGQERYIRYARKHDRFQNPAITGTDGQGWTAALNHFGGITNYHIVASRTFRAAIRSAAMSLRATGEPVGLVIEHHNHAWVMTGFESTTDPAVDSGFTLTAVYIMGPLYPRPASHGLDPRPDSRLTVRQMKRYLTTYRDAAVKPNNPWEGTYVTIQP